MFLKVCKVLWQLPSSSISASFCSDTTPEILEIELGRKDLKYCVLCEHSNCKIEIDGGVTSAYAKDLIDCGADVLVAGSFVFKADNPTQTISDLKNF